MYGFCGNNALHEARFSFTVFFFLLTPIDTCDCYFFDLILIIVVLLIEV